MPWQAGTMELDELLTTLDKVAVNLTKLERVWERAQPYLPDSPSFGSHPEYQTLARTWQDLLSGLPPIDGWKIAEDLPDMDGLGGAFLEYAEIGELPVGAWAAASKPGEDLAEYRYRLTRARRRAVGSRLIELTEYVTTLLQRIVEELPSRDSSAIELQAVSTPATQLVGEAVAEIERLLGDTVQRTGRWADLHRHLRFSEVHDWHDIVEIDWPSVCADIEAAQVGDEDPIPVPDIDLGAAAATATGRVTTALDWSALKKASEFERLLFDVLRGLDGYQNVQWLMNTNAPDRGRDLSLERVVRDSAGTVRTERVVVQAKHWTSKSVTPVDIWQSLASLSTWEPPIIRGLIIATSGRFTTDAVAVVEKHNVDGKMPYIDLWPENKIEILLTERPDLAIKYELRS